MKFIKIIVMIGLIFCLYAAKPEVCLADESVSVVTDSSDQNGIMNVQPISWDTFEAWIMGIFGKVVGTLRKIAAPYFFIVMALGTLILVLPFKTPMKKYTGWGTIFTALLAYFIVNWGPMFLGILKGLSSQ